MEVVPNLTTLVAIVNTFVTAGTGGNSGGPGGHARRHPEGTAGGLGQGAREPRPNPRTEAPGARRRRDSRGHGGGMGRAPRARPRGQAGGIAFCGAGPRYRRGSDVQPNRSAGRRRSTSTTTATAGEAHGPRARNRRPPTLGEGRRPADGGWRMASGRGPRRQRLRRRTAGGPGGAPEPAPASGAIGIVRRLGTAADRRGGSCRGGVRGRRRGRRRPGRRRRPWRRGGGRAGIGSPAPVSVPVDTSTAGDGRSVSGGRPGPRRWTGTASRAQRVARAFVYLPKGDRKGCKFLKRNTAFSLTLQLVLGGDTPPY